MLILLAGENSFAQHEAYEALRAQHNADGALGNNTIVLEGARTSPAELEAAALTVPFLAEYRLVRVNGLGRRLAGGGRRRSLGEWDALPEVLAQVPPTTLLVFLDGKLTGANPLRRAVADAGGDVRDFNPVRESELAPWVRGRARALGLHLTPPAERALIQLVGADQWALAGELEKLRIYAGDEAVDEAVVASLVARSREGNIFQLVDAVAEGRTTRALHALDAIRRDGESPQRMIGMLARQYRLIAVAREVLDAGGGQREVQSALGVQEFVARRAMAQAQRYDQAAADAAIGRVLEAEEAVQNYWQGRDDGMNQDLAVELLVSELAQGVAG